MQQHGFTSSKSRQIIFGSVFCSYQANATFFRPAARTLRKQKTRKPLLAAGLMDFKGSHWTTIWCRRPDSNRHGSPHTPLKRARLPIPPLRHIRIYLLFGRLVGFGVVFFCGRRRFFHVLFDWRRHLIFFRQRLGNLGRRGRRLTHAAHNRGRTGRR